MYKHILIPTDGSLLADAGVRHGIDLASFTGGWLAEDGKAPRGEPSRDS